MQVVCSKCSRLLEFSGDRPSFCAYCGQALSKTEALDTPSAFAAEDSTQALPEQMAQTAVLAPKTLGGYRLVRDLGSGGMGAVYEAEESSSGRKVALKLISPEFARSPDAVDRFRQEGRIASMVSHPRCVFVLTVDEEAGQPYIVMELMPGSTLKDLVDRQGPLSPEQAIDKILDVIEGLQAAHRLEVIHRDVKPSNCFLELDGRVKVGDFGLAKSLVKDSHLTKTGAFVGTPHFASPEQVRSEPIDRQTDVYSVAATLYYLLTGHPPYWGSDSTATLARIVSDPVPSMRELRPELSPSLDRVVLRGLERDRKRRWEDLEALKQALLSLVPERLSLPGLGLRLAAYGVDFILLWVVSLALAAILGAAFAGSGLPEREASVLALVRGIALVLFFLYFTVLEHGLGCSLGKGIFRLRVCTTRWVDPPGWGAAAVRTAVFLGLIHLGWLVSAAVLLAQSGSIRNDAQWQSAVDAIDYLVPWSWAAAGLLVLVSTMRTRGDYRGLHEVVSGTRVALLPAPRQRQTLLGSGGWLLSFLQSARLKQTPGQHMALPERIAGYSIRGALKWTPSEKVVLGEDTSVGRRVFIWLRPATEPPLDRTRRDVGRRTRLRWLARGRQGDLQWDAILAPLGCPLPEFIRSEGAMNWPEARLLLEDLAGELAAACAEGTLPPRLTTAQVWVQPDGRAQLADTALTASPAEEGSSATGLDQQRALVLLRRVAILALEGQARPAGAAGSIQASLPFAAKSVVDKLLGIGGSYEEVSQFQTALAAMPEE
jgi:uncharacterized RDD family membrane protein YckC